MDSKVLLAATFAAFIAAAGCTESSVGPAGEDTSRPPRVETAAIDCSDSEATDLTKELDYSADYLFRWSTWDGCDIRLAYIMTRRGGCSSLVEDILMGWPLGTTHDQHDYRIYIRDPKGISAVPRDGFDADARLPDDAFDTGLRQEGVALWMRPERDSFIWLVGVDKAERWPLEEPAFLCA